MVPARGYSCLPGGLQTGKRGWLSCMLAILTGRDCPLSQVPRPSQQIQSPTIRAPGTQAWTCTEKEFDDTAHSPLSAPLTSIPGNPVQQALEWQGSGFKCQSYDSALLLASREKGRGWRAWGCSRRFYGHRWKYRQYMGLAGNETGS